ncbi:MAG: helix-turn-helix domain-containing protein [Bacteroidota bacterium]
MIGIGDKIRKIRNIRGYSQEYMGSRLHMSQNNYSRIELDQINLTLKTLEDIASVLDISTQDILNFQETQIFPSTAKNEERVVTIPYAPNHVVSMLQEEISSLREDRKRLILLLERNNARI